MMNDDEFGVLSKGLDIANPMRTLDTPLWRRLLAVPEWGNLSCPPIVNLCRFFNNLAASRAPS